MVKDTWQWHDKIVCSSNSRNKQYILVFLLTLEHSHGTPLYKLKCTHDATHVIDRRGLILRSQTHRSLTINLRSFYMRLKTLILSYKRFVRIYTMHAPCYRRVFTTFKATATWVINRHFLNNAHFIIHHIEHQVPMYVVYNVYPFVSIDILFLLHRYDWWLYEIYRLFN